VPWLYEVSVPVASQSTEERTRAAGDALLTLLTRLTGLAHVPRTAEVNQALDTAERYYSEFRFASAADEGLELVIQFEPASVLELIREAGLPIWRATRDQILVWVVVQEGSERSLVGATSESPMLAGFEGRALDRGLPLTIPLLDLEDQLAVDTTAVWGRLSQVVDPASERYGADVLLLGRVVQTPAGDWESDWEFWVDGVDVPFSAKGMDLTAQAVQVVDLLADELAGRRVVHGRQTGQLLVAIGGVATPGDYGALLNYVRSLEFVEQVGVAGMHDNRLWLTIDTPADAERLLRAFQRDRRLYDDQLAMVDAADLRLVWRSSD